LIIAICGAVCGANDRVAISAFGKAKQDWLRIFLELPNGIPSHDTFTDVSAKIDPDRFRECFLSWTNSPAELPPGDIVAIDGKTLRRSYDKEGSRSSVHMVSAWAGRNSLVLGQIKTEKKSNEITAIPELLEVLELTGCIVTIKEMVHKILQL
jgi:hypothetical protein